MAIAWMGGGASPYRLFNGGSVSSLVASPGTANAGVTLQTDGTVTFLSSGGSAPSGVAWYTPTTVGIGSTHWARCTVNSGTLSSATATGVWLDISTGRTWSRNRTTVGTNNANITIQIATDSGGTNIVASATFPLSAEVF